MGVSFLMLALAAYADAEPGAEQAPTQSRGKGSDETVIGITICMDQPVSGLDLDGIHPLPTEPSLLMICTGKLRSRSRGYATDAPA